MIGPLFRTKTVERQAFFASAVPLFPWAPRWLFYFAAVTNLAKVQVDHRSPNGLAETCNLDEFMGMVLFPATRHPFTRFV